MNEKLTTEELAGELKTPTATLRYWRAAGKGPRYFKAGKRVLYRREDVDAWISEQIQTPQTA